MNDASSVPKYDVSAGKIDQTVCPTRFPSLPLRQENRATIPSMERPRCSRYQRASPSGSLALKKMPPIPVTRLRRVRAAMPRKGFSETKGVPQTSSGQDRHHDGSTAGLEVGEDPQVFPQVPRDQEVTADPLPPRPAHRLPLRGIAEQLHGPVGAILDAGHEVAMTTVLDLEPNPGDVATDHGDALPEGLAHDQPEPFAERFRDRHVRLPLEDVHLEGADPAEIGEEVDVRIIPRMSGRALEPHPPFRIVPGHGGHEQELNLRDLLFHQTIRIDDAQRIFPRIEPADLGDDGSVEIDVEARQDGLQLLPVHVAVLRARRIDGWRIDVVLRELDA